MRKILIDQSIAIFVGPCIERHQRLLRDEILRLAIAPVTKHEFVIRCAIDFLPVVERNANEGCIGASFLGGRFRSDHFPVRFTAPHPERFVPFA